LKEYEPVDVERVGITTVVASLMSLMVTLGTIAPDESVTVPVTPPVSTCANKGVKVLKIAQQAQLRRTLPSLRLRYFMTGPFKNIQSIRPLAIRSRLVQNESVKDADRGSPADSGSRRLKNGLNVREWRAVRIPCFPTLES
jgi:hypothetical protein